MDFKDTKVPQQRNLNKQNAKIPEAQPFRPIRAQRKLLPRPTPGVLWIDSAAYTLRY